METVAFYSYKGGVGRSLLLANAAHFLATLGKGVVALDFDLEAPGLHYKLVSEERKVPAGGAVPYLVATADAASSPPSLASHTVSLAVPPGANGWLRLMPAGPAPDESYWSALKEFKERVRLDDASGKGFMALLDLQARIAEELEPDYLLIDARTGVTEIGGLATTILADTVVCLFVGNEESLDGTLKVIEALKAAPRLDGQKPIRIVPVLSRATEAQLRDGRMVNEVKLLLNLTSTTKNKSKTEPKLFTLPHDDVLGTSDRLVAGEKKASAFSPLYKAYLELFQELFPARAEPAREVLDRLEAVANLRSELTRSRRDHFDDGMAPWSETAITESVSYKADRYSAKGERYADLVCRNDAGKALLIVEYGDASSMVEALEFWGKKTNVACVVFLMRNQNRHVERKLFAREPDDGNLRAVDRWDLPSPLEFELLRDIGDRSIESMLDALRHGHTEASAWLVNEWKESAIGVGMHRGPRWRPERARRILDGLAAIEDVECAVAVLRQAEDGDHYSLRPKYRDDWLLAEDSDRKLAEELFAPLFWRLPVEAVLKSLHPHRHPDEHPPTAGYRLFAETLMGLRYDPESNALEDARAAATRRLRSTVEAEEDSDEHVAAWLHRNRRQLLERVRLSEEAPPLLVWDEILRDEPYWRGSLEEAREKVREKLTKVIGSNSTLRSRLRAIAKRRELSTHGLLGAPHPSGHLDLYPAVITATAEVIGVSPRHLKNVVFIHLSAWDLAHESRDLDGQRGDAFAPFLHASPFGRLSPSHIALMQTFTDRLILSLKDANLNSAFETLSARQPEPYGQWSAMRNLPIEQLRVLLLRARGSAGALGLPSLEEGHSDNT